MNFKNLKQIYTKDINLYSQENKKSYYHRYGFGFNFNLLENCTLEYSGSYRIICNIGKSIVKNNTIYEQNMESSDKLYKKLLIDKSSLKEGLSKSHYHQCIKPLLDQNVIINESRTKYLINPYYFQVLSKSQFNSFLWLVMGDF